MILMHTKIDNFLFRGKKGYLPKISEYKERLRNTYVSHFVPLRIKLLFEQKGLLLTDYSRVNIEYVLKGPCISLRYWRYQTLSM